MFEKIGHFIGNFLAFDAENLSFHIPNKGELSQLMGLKETARELGVNNIPRPNDSQKDSIANEIDSLLGQVIESSVKSVNRHIRVVEKLLNFQAASEN